MFANFGQKIEPISRGADLGDFVKCGLCVSQRSKADTAKTRRDIIIERERERSSKKESDI